MNCIIIHVFIDVVAGAFGTAHLFRCRTDSSLVVIKEINVVDLNGSDRELAFGEAELMSTASHPNIVHFFNKYECDGRWKAARTQLVQYIVYS